jgi:hypothetical protein
MEKLQSDRNAGIFLTSTDTKVQLKIVMQQPHLAPAGYLTLSEKGLILNTNLTTATLLGVERHQNFVERNIRKNLEMKVMYVREHPRENQ